MTVSWAPDTAPPAGKYVGAHRWPNRARSSHRGQCGSGCSGGRISRTVGEGTFHVFCPGCMKTSAGDMGKATLLGSRMAAPADPNRTEAR